MTRHKTFISSADRDLFDQVVVAHLDAAYNLARWLTRNERDAEDVVQEACLRAFRFLDTYRGGYPRAWLLSIVRNTYYSQLKKNRWQALNVPFDEDFASLADDDVHPGWDASEGDEATRGLERADAKRLVEQALLRLPEEFREIIVLRELEDLSYKEIASITNIPLGTVMSRLSRARKLLCRAMKVLGQE